MKLSKIYSLFAIFAIFFMLTCTQQASATVSSAVGVRVLFSQVNATTTAWLTLVNSTAKAIKGISVLNTSPVPLVLAMGASNSELAQLILPSCQATGTGVCTPTAVYFPFVASQSQKLAIEALNSNAATGEIQFNLFYN